MIIRNGRIAYHSYRLTGDGVDFVQYDFEGKEVLQAKEMIK
jgi:hypothetical protein